MDHQHSDHVKCMSARCAAVSYTFGFTDTHGLGFHNRDSVTLDRSDLRVSVDAVKVMHVVIYIQSLLNLCGRILRGICYMYVRTTFMYFLQLSST